jgi:hypothetical protein
MKPADFGGSVEIGERTRNICKEAMKIAYRPTAFLKVIEEDGALVTAKRLISRNADSSGG